MHWMPLSVDTNSGRWPRTRLAYSAQSLPGQWLSPPLESSSPLGARTLGTISLATLSPRNFFISPCRDQVIILKFKSWLGDSVQVLHSELKLGASRLRHGQTNDRNHTYRRDQWYNRASTSDTGWQMQHKQNKQHTFRVRATRSDAFDC